MKLYYDTLIPFMPTASVDETGKLVPDESKSACRQAMIELSNFQTSGNIMSLYQSVMFACKYVNIDLVDAVLSEKDVKLKEGATAGYLIDEAAKLLFRSINPDYEFDIDKFVTYVLTAAHAMFLSLQESEQKKEKESEETV